LGIGRRTNDSTPEKFAVKKRTRTQGYSASREEGEEEGAEEGEEGEEEGEEEEEEEEEEAEEEEEEEESLTHFSLWQSGRAHPPAGCGT
jgi:hypothetical protein